MLLRKMVSRLILVLCLTSLMMHPSQAMEYVLAHDMSNESPAIPGQAPMSDQRIQDLLKQRVDTWHRGVGIVVGIVSPEGRRVIAYGKTAAEKGEAVDRHTVFEIGSVTKVFTSLLLSDMVQRGEVALDDPVAKYLPNTVKVPQRDGQQIRLRDLPQQVSGLPRMPSNFSPKNNADPYTDYSSEQLFQFLSSYQLTRPIGSQYEYSNLGMGLLGEALARRAGKDYASLLKERILNVLHMPNSDTSNNSDMQKRLALGHDVNLQLVPSWTWQSQALAGAGGLRSTVDDMLNFMAAQLGLTVTPLRDAMQTTQTQALPTGIPNLDIALAWHILKKPSGGEIVWHNGGTGGYRSFVGLDRASQSAVVVLSNVGDDLGVDDIGRHLLDPTFPLANPPKPLEVPKEVQVDPSTFASMVGVYQLNVGPRITISGEGDALYAQQENQVKVRIYPEQARRFFSKVHHAKISFDPEVDGKTNGILVFVGEETYPGKRITSNANAIKPAKPNYVTLSESVLDAYVGKYQLAPNFIISLYRQGQQLLAQATNQPQIEMFATDATHFELPSVNAKITINLDSSNKAVSLTLHQGGASPVAQRIE